MKRPWKIRNRGNGRVLRSYSTEDHAMPLVAYLTQRHPNLAIGFDLVDPEGKTYPLMSLARTIAVIQRIDEVGNALLSEARGT